MRTLETRILNRNQGYSHSKYTHWFGGKNYYNDLPTIKKLGIPGLHPIPTILELVYRSKIKIEGVLDDEIVSLDSWEYPMDLLVLQPRSVFEGHSVILGRY